MKRITSSEKLVIANKKIGVHKKDKALRAGELSVANKELQYQHKEKEKRAKELVIANKELAFQNKEKEKRAKELIIANRKLVSENIEKEKRAAKLIIANKELKFQNAEKEKRAKELVGINKQLAAQKLQLEDFCNIISHNLRAPLVNISMLVDFIIDAQDEAEKNEIGENLKVSTVLLNETFNELIESLQIKQDSSIRSENLSLDDYIKKACDGLMGQIMKSKAIIEVDTDKAPVINFPSKYLSSILHNLISNSLKYASPNRQLKIKIKTAKTDESVILSVSDNGLGIDTVKHKDNLFKIRKVFHHHPEAKGFGLFIIKTQIEAIGGRIWLESKPNKGSVFYVEFRN